MYYKLSRRLAGKRNGVKISVNNAQTTIDKLRPENLYNLILSIKRINTRLLENFKVFNSTFLSHLQRLVSNYINFGEQNFRGRFEGSFASPPNQTDESVTVARGQI